MMKVRIEVRLKEIPQCSIVRCGKENQAESATDFQSKRPIEADTSVPTRRAITIEPVLNSFCTRGKRIEIATQIKRVRAVMEASSMFW